MGSNPSMSTVSSGDSPRAKRARKNAKMTKTNNGNATKSRGSPEAKRPRTGGETGASKSSYDYMTKLNYLFRDSRFFVIKSNNSENVGLSKAKGVWSTLPQNEANLNKAFKECRNVLLIFSVKESGKFAGFARMSTESKRGPQIDWVLPPGISAKALGGVFDIDWICKKELSFTCTTHLYNPWNEGKPVKIGRDGQEIEPKVAQELCKLFPEDDAIEMLPVLKKSKEAGRILREKGVKPVVNRKPYIRMPPMRGGRGGGGGSSLRGGRGAPPNRKFIPGKRGGPGPPGLPFRKPGPGFPPKNRLTWDKRYSTSAAAEAYVADYMRQMQHQLPPLPYAPPPGFLPPLDGLPPPLPRYYDAGLPHDYAGSSNRPPPPPNFFGGDKRYDPPMLGGGNGGGSGNDKYSSHPYPKESRPKLMPPGGRPDYRDKERNNSAPADRRKPGGGKSENWNHHPRDTKYRYRGRR